MAFGGIWLIVTFVVIVMCGSKVGMLTWFGTFLIVTAIKSAAGRVEVY